MGIRVTVGGIDYEVTDYSVSEEATPLAAGDGSGSVGTFSFTIARPDPDLEERFTPNAFTNPGFLVPGLPAIEEDPGDPGTYITLGYLTEDPGDPGTYIVVPESPIYEDVTDPGTYLIRYTPADVTRDVMAYRIDGWPTDGSYYLYVVDNAEITVSNPATVTIIARTAGQTVTLGGDSATSVNDGEVLMVSGSGTLSLGPGGWSSPYIAEAGTQTILVSNINKYGPEWLIGQEVQLLSDTNYGFTLGTVDAISDDPALIQVSCLSRLGALNIYNVQAQPFIGTLEQAFEYYASLAGITTGVVVDSTIASRNVTLPGFSGELWYHLKQLAAAQDCDISLVSGVILLRPIRARVAERGRTIQRTGSTGGGSLAQAVEVYWYNTRSITDELIYPTGGWNPEVEVLNVNAGETTEYPLELSASLTSIEQPVMQTFVASDYDASSVYTIVADDGFAVPVAQWEANGGKVEVTLNPDTTSLTVTLTGATNIPVTTGGDSKAFSLALASDSSGNRYSTLRIVGTGVAYIKEKRRIRTGVSAERTSTDIGVTIDNPFITSIDDLYRAGVRAAKAYAGVVPSISGTVSTVTPRGNSGVVEALSYQAVEDALELELGGGFTYAEAATQLTVTMELMTYGEIYDYWLSQTADDFANQTFGNVQGARIWDPTRKRWFRIRSATTTAENINIEAADDDLTIGDVEEFFNQQGLTYGLVQTYRSGLTYQQEGMVGLRVS